MSRSIEEWTQWRALLLARAPDKARYHRYYTSLDVRVPDWTTFVRRVEFLTWGARPDTQDGVCMLDRMYALWRDPAYTCEQFAVLLRLFIAALAGSPATSQNSSKNRLVGLLPQPVIQINQVHLPVIYGRYELIRSLGRGGNGEVFLAWSRETSSLYALKLIRRELTTDPVVRQSFRREADIWIRPGDHPNVAKAHFFDDIAGELHVTMDYLEGDEFGGPSLEDKICAGRSTIESISRWFVQVADGLAHAYLHGLTSHRDIKPGNILIGRDGIARISDFGLAIPVATRSPLLAIAGTPHYMSPEQFDESQPCDVRSDIYSLGVTLYQAASGGLVPFSPSFENLEDGDAIARFIVEIRAMHTHVHPAPIDSPLWGVIARCLAKDRKSRFQNIADFRAAIVGVAETLGYEMPAPPKSALEVWTLRDQANSLMRLGHYEDALKAFDAFLSSIPDEPAAFNRAVCLENLGSHEDALRVYRKFAEADDAKALVNGSNCLKVLGRKQEALEYARRATELLPDDSDCWIALGNVAFSLQVWGDAIRAYMKAHSLDPSSPTPLYNAGLAAERGSDFRTAIEVFKAFLHVAQPEDHRREYVIERLNDWLPI